MVMAHVVWLPYEKIFKAYIFKALGLWNWEAETVRSPSVTSCKTVVENLPNCIMLRVSISQHAVWP
jgi:hypothetical protein